MNFKDWRLRTKFLFSFLLLIFLSLAMSSVLHYYASTNLMKGMSSRSSALLLEQVALNFEQKIQEVEELSFAQYKNAGFCPMMIDKDKNNYDDIAKEQSIRQFLYKMVYSNAIFPYAAVYDRNGEMYAQFRLGSTNHPVLSGFKLSKADIERLNDKRGQTIWSQGDEEIIFMKRAMYDLQSSAYCGSLVLGVESEYFKSIYPHSEESGEIMYTNGEGELIIYNNSFSEELFLAAAAREDQEFYHGNKKYIHISNSTSDSRWRLHNIISFNQFTSYMKTIQFWLLVTFIVAFAAAFINAALLSKSITNKLYILVNRMKTLSVGALDTVIRTDGRDEIGIIAEKFNGMAAKIKELIHEASQEKLKKERAEYKQLEFEYKALQAQMNPHFLYNTLESIHSMAKINGQQEIGQSIYLLGRLIRESISRKRDFIALREEIQFIRDYLTLQGITYESRLQVKYEIEESALEWIVPRFILQPILENAIIHGIEKKSGVGIIHIRCCDKGEHLMLEVEDNGVGIREDMIQALLREEEYALTAADSGSGSGGTRVGVRSVHKRLRILFGADYGIEIRSELHQGTRIIIKLPKTGKEDIHAGDESGGY